MSRTVEDKRILKHNAVLTIKDRRNRVGKQEYKQEVSEMLAKENPESRDYEGDVRRWTMQA